MIGLKNIISYKYFGVDVEIIWKIITENLPETEPELKNLLNKIEIVDTSLEEEDRFIFDSLRECRQCAICS